MDVDIMTAMMGQFHDQCQRLAKRKNVDYHPDNVAYLEILQTAWESGITVEQDLWGRVRKQFSALRNYVILGQYASEPPRQRMIDIANYMAILAVWDEEKTHVLLDALNFVSEKRSCESRPFPSVLSAQDCNTCDRCEFRRWLEARYKASVSKDRSSPPTPKPQG